MAAAAGLTERITTRWDRLEPPRRLAGVDLARGLAVVGMLAAHLVVIDPFVLSEPSTWIDVVNGRSSILFATLAGVSIGLVTGGTTPIRGEDRARASGRLALRGAFLWMIGILLMFTGVPVYVILPAYAILFVLALPFVGLRAPALFALAAVVALVMPWMQVMLDALPFWSTPFGVQAALAIGWHYPFTTWIAFVLAGMGLARADLRATRTAVVALVVGGAIALPATLLAGATGSDAVAERTTYLGAVWTADAHSTGLLEVIGSGAFAIAVIGGAVLVCRSAVVRWVMVPLRAVGAMPLTAYSAQILLWALAAVILLSSPADLGGFRDLSPFWPMTLGILVGCTLWALLLGRGPLESAIDGATRWLVPPRTPSALDAAVHADKLDR